MLDHDGNELRIGDRVVHHDLRSVDASGRSGPRCLSHEIGEHPRTVEDFASSTCVRVSPINRMSNVFLACLLRKVA